MLARCAHCQETFHLNGFGKQRCPHCGTLIEPKEPLSEGKPFEPPESSPVSSPKDDHWKEMDGKTPWELRHFQGFFQSLWRTALDCLISPVRFYQAMRPGNSEGAVSFWWVSHAAAWVAASVWNVAVILMLIPFVADEIGLSRNSLKEEMMSLLIQAAPRFGIAALGFAVFLALFPVVLFVFSGVIHAFVRLLGANRTGFNSTLKAVGYSSAPVIFFWFIPFLGLLLASLVECPLIVIGLAQLHKASYLRATLVFLASVSLIPLVFVILGILFF